ncbi:MULTISPECIES: carbohydrate ABC transporter permease [Ruminococcus]|jgi:multiple sugar transport system permease protein|uniref:Multiple sugar transport system permease protein n=1 Tax=Ruminococcus flavefaciens TaxID=1265 RepID=A0A315XZU5_RUMFL|nr:MULTISPECIES: carbohydrate ABC transporter permease [Ruminococcus]MBR1432971.1 carbohydrate ABC transporter permease [Ruminococcus sp.]PWJ12958.1 multiple sugar transport system permease protein [Ruminococcus flavefaciens]SSA48522.1 multiple sugar transport system permease protein [Ruminococcus flavefaciens]
MAVVNKKASSYAFKIFAYAFCILLTVLSLFPFVIMIVNATRNTAEIQSHAVSFIPGHNFKTNWNILMGRGFSPIDGFKNSLIVSVGSTACNVYFSTMTAFALVAYDWKLRKPFFTVIMAVLMIPAQVTSIGFYSFMYKIQWTNSFLPLILPTIAAPTTVFFMRQYMIPSLPMEILQSARIDGAGEFRIFNQIVLPMMKPAMATQAIFCFVTSWNQLFMPQILITRMEKYTMPMMVSLLNGDAYKTEYGSVYLGLLLTVIPILIAYFLLSKYIIEGVALGGVKG